MRTDEAFGFDMRFAGPPDPATCNSIESRQLRSGEPHHAPTSRRRDGKRPFLLRRVRTVRYAPVLLVALALLAGAGLRARYGGGATSDRSGAPAPGEG
jgi:hypothetical protein